MPRPALSAEELENRRKYLLAAGWTRTTLELFGVVGEGWQSPRGYGSARPLTNAYKSQQTFEKAQVAKRRKK